MPYYKKHVFFCTNEKTNGRKCCQMAGATDMWQYARTRIKELGLSGEGGIRVNRSGCLGRCSLGPTIVIYPDGIWYTYEDERDIDEIIQEHLVNDVIVDRLLIKKESELSQ